MKKSLIGIFIFAIIISSFFVSALENSSIGEISLDKEGIKEDLTNTGQEVKSSFKEQFANQREIPDSISFLPKIFFGIEDEISLSELIIYSVLWILVLLFINSVISFVPIFEGKTWIVSVIIMLLFGLSGGIKNGATIWIAMLSSIPLLENIGSWTISILVILLSVGFILLNKIRKTVKESSKLAQASYEGMKAGAGIALAKVRSRY